VGFERFWKILYRLIGNGARNSPPVIMTGTDIFSIFGNHPSTNCMQFNIVEHLDVPLLRKYTLHAPTLITGIFWLVKIIVFSNASNTCVDT
jgi:hypothetical protein